MYLQRVANRRKSNDGIHKTQLLLSTVKPYVEVISSTVARWLKNVMSAAGVDTTIFKSHSARSASTHEAAAQGFLSKIFWNVQIGLAQQLLRNSIRNQLTLFTKILSVMCLFCAFFFVLL